MVTAQTCNHNIKGERDKNSVSDDHEPSFNEEVGDGHNESYIGDDSSMDGGSGFT